MTNIIKFPIAQITVKDGRRPANNETIERLKESIDRFGLLHPVTVHRHARGTDLVAGFHRLLACKDLNMSTVPAVVIEHNDVQAEMVEISENLHRCELTALERSEQIARWVELYDTGVLTQLESKPPLGGRPKSGARAAARDLGINRNEAQRAKKVASLTPDAKQTAVEVGLDDNRSAMLDAAKQAPEKQAEYLEKRAAQILQPKSDIAIKIIKGRQARILDLIIGSLNQHENEVLILLRESEWNGNEMFREMLQRLESRSGNYG